MLLYLRWWIVRSVAWCLRLQQYVAPYPVIKAKVETGGILVVRYELHGVRAELCGCPDCRAVRGEINGSPASEVLP